MQVAGFVVALAGQGRNRRRGDRSRIDDAGVRDASAGRQATPSTSSASGGDRSHTVNISTMAAIVAAATGVRVAKHGNRAASSSCGSADVLEELGVAIDLSRRRVRVVLCRGGHRLLLCADLPPGTAARRRAAARTRRPDCLQFPRTADESGAADGERCGCRRSAYGGRARRCSGAARQPGARVSRRRWARRADHDHDVAGVGGQRGGRRHQVSLDPAVLGPQDCARPRTCAAPTPPITRPSCTDCCRVSGVRCAMRSC